MPQELVDMTDELWSFFFNFFYTIGERIKGLIFSVIPDEILPKEN